LSYQLSKRPKNVHGVTTGVDTQALKVGAVRHQKDELADGGNTKGKDQLSGEEDKWEVGFLRKWSIVVGEMVGTGSIRNS